MHSIYDRPEFRAETVAKRKKNSRGRRRVRCEKIYLKNHYYFRHKAKKKH